MTLRQSATTLYPGTDAKRSLLMEDLRKNGQDAFCANDAALSADAPIWLLASGLISIASLPDPTHTRNSRQELDPH